MNAEQARLILDGWEQLMARGDDISDAFYARLFSLAPATREMFGQVDMIVQRRKFFEMLSTLVRLAEDPAEVVAAAIPLAQRHVQYGVSEEHVAVGRQAFAETIETALGEDFTPEAHQAWLHLYDLAAAVMRRAQERLTYSASPTPLSTPPAPRPLASSTAR